MVSVRGMLPSGGQVAKAAVLVLAVLLVLGAVVRFFPAVKNVPILGLAFERL